MGRPKQSEILPLNPNPNKVRLHLKPTMGLDGAGTTNP